MTDDLTISASAVPKAVVPTTPVPTPTPEPEHKGVYHAAYINGIGNGLFAPERTCTRAEALTMLLRACMNTEEGLKINGLMVPTPFIDVSSAAWYYDYVNYAYNQGLLFGLHNTTNMNAFVFRPDEPITRAEFVEMVCHFKYLQASGPSATKFADVLPGHWASSLINYASNQGWIQGYTNGNFGPDDSLSRAQMVAIINRVLDRIPSASGIINAATVPVTFVDVPPSHWAYLYITEAATGHYGDMKDGSEIWFGN